ncbi:hypothetical protein [Pseudoroseomonas cervicalis]|uniref:head-tail joining protein n=1 Tax=Teichococcus cervicalis TaxID=204525 RepID=UPI0022F1627C|nr:hypothetical protein [Pseudoroseomonas cervicalis]WBV42733.1 hypothetical protein PFY06_16035 [Pseudoroseomonas cervicalis]
MAPPDFGALNASTLDILGEVAAFRPRRPEAHFHPPGLSSERVLEGRGVFTRAQRRTVVGNDGMPATITETTLLVDLDELQRRHGYAPIQGDQVTVAGGAWLLTDVRDDADGMALLVLGRIQMGGAR